MRICMIYQGHDATMERIVKAGKSLSAAGHAVFLCCNNYGEPASNTGKLGAIRVLPLPPVSRWRAVNKIVNLPVFFNPRWVVHLLRAIRRHRIEALHVIDIPLAIAAILLGRAFHIPVVMDMWENYPEALRLWERQDWKRRIFKNHRLARLVEAYCVRNVHHVITVVEEQRERLAAAGVPRDRLSVVTNAIDPEYFLGSVRSTANAREAPDGEFRLLYVGELSLERGLDDILRALPLVKTRLPGIRLDIGGSGPDESRLRQLTVELGVTEQVRFHGRIPFHEIPAFIATAGLCLVPHVFSPFINTTMPNKLFQYMMMGKPVLVSHARPLERIVRESGCGYVFESGNAADAADKILQAYAERSAAERMGERGRGYVREHCTWDKAVEPLLKLYARLEPGS